MRAVLIDSLPGNRAGVALVTSLRVVIVNFNGGDHLVRCLRSFSAVADDRIELECVTIVDNSSTDGSIDRAQAFSDRLPLRIVRNTENRGFAAGSNQGAGGSSADFLLFLNPDTELRPGSLETPAQFLATDRNSHYGIAGIRLVDGLGHDSRSCSRHPSLASLVGHSLGLHEVLPRIFRPHFLPDHAHAESRRVDQVMGAFFLVRRSLFERLGGFDERFFMYFEDADFALRAQEVGFATAFLAGASAVHAGHGSSGRVKARRLFYFGRSRIRFGAKHFGFAGGLAVAAATLVVEPLLRAGRAVLTGRLDELRDIVRGAAMLWTDLLPRASKSGGYRNA